MISVAAIARLKKKKPDTSLGCNSIQPMRTKHDEKAGTLTNLPIDDRYPPGRRAAARLKTRIVDDALRGRISYRAAESLIARHHLESE